MYQKFGQDFDPSKPSKSKDTAVLSWGIKKKKCRICFKNLVPNFDPFKPYKSKDIAVLSWGIFQKK